MPAKSLIPYLLAAGLLPVGLAVCADNSEAPSEEDSKVFRKLHPDGVVEFSDQPTRGSEELKVEELPTYKFSTPARSGSNIPPPARPTPAKPAQAASPYTSLAITRPSHDETIRSNNGDIDVKFSLQPTLQYYQGHKIEYLLDGRSVLKSERPQILKNVSRGTHSLVIQVIDKNNNILINSNSVSFHIKRYFKPSSKAKPAVPVLPAAEMESES